MNRRTTSSAALLGGWLSMMMVCSAGYGGNLELQWLVHENCYPLNAYYWSFDAGHRLRTQDTDDDATATVYIGPRPMMTTLRMNDQNEWEVFYDPGDAIAFGWRWEGDQGETGVLDMTDEEEFTSFTGAVHNAMQSLAAYWYDGLISAVILVRFYDRGLDFDPAGGAYLVFGGGAPNYIVLSEQLPPPFEGELADGGTLAHELGHRAGLNYEVTGLWGVMRVMFQSVFIFPGNVDIRAPRLTLTAEEKNAFESSPE